nr:hypothetical protein [Tanacetum cinerariifolium]
MFHFPADFVAVDFEPDPRVPLILGRCFLKTSRALINVHKGELTLQIRNEAITYNLDQTSRYSANYDQMTANKIDVTDEACEECSQEVLGFFDVTASGSPTPSDDLIISTTSPTLTQFGDSDFLLFEEADAFLGLEDDLDSPELDPSYYDPEGDILSLEAILNSDPSPPLPNLEQFVPSFKEELKACEAKTIKSSIHEPPEEKAALIKVLKSHKRAIAWKLSDIQGRSPIVACLSVYAMHRARFKGTKCCKGVKTPNYVSIGRRATLWSKRALSSAINFIKNEIEVDKAKIDVIAKLPYPTTVKDCIQAFQTLKKKLTEAPILIAPKWDLPFELMCDASDFAIDFANYHAGNFLLKGMSTQKKNKFFKDVKHYFWDDPFLFKLSTICQNGLKRKRSPPMTMERPVIFRLNSSTKPIGP